MGHLHNSVFFVDYQHAKGADHSLIIKCEMEPNRDNRCKGQGECKLCQVVLNEMKLTLTRFL